ncbi:hypothetical protein BDP81DRAFT_453050 [Colletotrichum phormii]|uniref:Uncharacterized protein n=1 Tax=Colletotrichum phormii TaxID=359342 RepID=A0AAI9ZID6_9PEZI|nr:uncharacterized protein BDP81DRAFT_453050 [Colletotrichum phormii]KAK1625122.1 hypothetical protein BDP81DRAFT_453050 [Colletotrichum phormii]
MPALGGCSGKGCERWTLEEGGKGSQKCSVREVGDHRMKRSESEVSGVKCERKYQAVKTGACSGTETGNKAKEADAGALLVVGLSDKPRWCESLRHYAYGGSRDRVSMSIGYRRASRMKARFPGYGENNHMGGWIRRRDARNKWERGLRCNSGVRGETETEHEIRHGKAARRHSAGADGGRTLLSRATATFTQIEDSTHLTRDGDWS